MHEIESASATSKPAGKRLEVESQPTGHQSCQHHEKYDRFLLGTD